MSLFKRLIMITIVGLLVVGVYGCEKEGPAESAGKKMDKAMDDAKDTLDDASK